MTTRCATHEVATRGVTLYPTESGSVARHGRVHGDVCFLSMHGAFGLSQAGANIVGEGNRQLEWCREKPQFEPRLDLRSVGIAYRCDKLWSGKFWIGVRP